MSTTMPTVNFSTFILSIASTALVHLGEVPDPANNETKQNKSMAQNTIDVLSMLQEKTKGNLDRKEDEMLSSLIYELKMKFVKHFGANDKSEN